eukprot:CAMPEP_0175104228 /NCGR_PEP_ID=MMETSP0086_2-20121207/9586_1 /TAXON_ID=136419 /ORGANISM="Unknown Unknown, Strain D1" /LENGTH=828 /DNA_ID=CAMNT_0016379547 /DNA_START=70 /DNA_END=2556 /DNA_ORIENTATION=+
MARNLVLLSVALGSFSVPLNFEEVHESIVPESHHAHSVHTGAHSVHTGKTKTEPNRCVSKHASVTDSYCAKVKCDPRYSEYCVWLHSKEAEQLLAKRVSAAKAGHGAKSFAAAVNQAAAKKGPHRHHPRSPIVEADGKVVAMFDKQDADVHDAVLRNTTGKCFVPVTWFPHRSCGHPSAAVCQRGWGTYDSKADCCEEQAAFSSGCSNFEEPLKFKNKVISQVLATDPRIAQDEAAWLREMSFQLQQREAMLKYGKKAVLPTTAQTAPHLVPGVVVPQNPLAFHGNGAAHYVFKQKTPLTQVEAHPPLTPISETEARPPQDVSPRSNPDAGVFHTVKSHSEVPKIFTQQDWYKLFPNANFHSEPAIYTYANFINATSFFPLFASVGTVQERKRELAAFFAHISQETSGWWKGQEYVWGLTYNREEGCGESKDACNLYAACSKAKKDQHFPCAFGKGYFGRGPMMVAWNYNYGELSHYLFADNRLLLHPDTVANDGVVAFMSALWFWMEPHGGFGKPSSHDAFTGLWRPSLQDRVAGRAPGFGLTLNIVDGKKLCLHDPVPEVAQHRISYYLRACTILKVHPGDHVNCKTQIPFVTDFGHPIQMYHKHKQSSVNTAFSAYKAPHPGKHVSLPAKVFNTTHMVMGDGSYHPIHAALAHTASHTTAAHQAVQMPSHQSHAHQPAHLVALPANPMDKYKFLQTGRKCAESDRILLECGDCGPGLTDFDACRSMCDEHMDCQFFNYFNDKSCSLFSECSKTHLNTRSVIYQKQMLGLAAHPTNPAGTWPYVHSGSKWLESAADLVAHNAAKAVSAASHLGLAELEDQLDAENE